MSEWDCCVTLTVIPAGPCSKSLAVATLLYSTTVRAQCSPCDCSCCLCWISSCKGTNRSSPGASDGCRCKREGAESGTAALGSAATPCHIHNILASTAAHCTLLAVMWLETIAAVLSFVLGLVFVLYGYSSLCHSKPQQHRDSMSAAAASDTVPLTDYQHYPLASNLHWTDITPLAQDDGPEPHVVPIAYSAQFTETMNYFRAIVKKQELSRRALALTALAIKCNNANYSAWYYRRLCLYHLNEDLRAEVTTMHKKAQCTVTYVLIPCPPAQWLMRFLSCCLLFSVYCSSIGAKVLHMTHRRTISCGTIVAAWSIA